MMPATERYKIHLAYHGHQFSGWQRQPDDRTVQGVIEACLFKRIRIPVTIVGCGRTDTGVHASSYMCHADLPSGDYGDIAFWLNRMLPEDIVIHDVERVSDDWHARFSATRRSYRYDISARRDVFRTHLLTYYPQWSKLSHEALHQVAALIKDYQSFEPFCKTGGDTAHALCQIYESHWEVDMHGGRYHVTANRFLRGMVRLIVGACLSVAAGQMSIDDVRRALDNRTSLPRPYSAPADGLYLTQVHYE